MFERALKICKKILKIWKKSGSRVNTRGIQKKRPKKSQSWKKIQTHEFVLKNNKKNASGGLRPPVGGPSGHLGGLATPWSHPPEQILRPCNNQSHTPTPIFSEIEERRRIRKNFIFFGIIIFYLLFVTKKTTEIGLTMCRKVRFHVWKLIWNGLLKGNVLSDSKRSQSKKKISGLKNVVLTA